MTDYTTLLSVRLFAGGADLTSQSNEVSIGLDVDELDVTTFLPEDDPDRGWKKVAGGLKFSAITAGGLWAAGDAGMVDDHHFTNFGTHVPFTVGPDGAGVGDRCFLTQALRAQYKLGGPVGQAHPWTANASGTGVTSRGLFLHPPGTARTSPAFGTAVEFRAVSSSETLYANLHVLSVSGTSTPTLEMIIQSDADENFDGSETTRITFANSTEIGSESQSLAGPITDTWYRVGWDVSGTDPSFLFVVSIGIK